ncbi:MAG: hypothetical protein ACYC5O_21050, partial [Anaerolineae bacterium]
MGETRAAGPTMATTDSAAPAMTPLERRLVVGADRFIYWLTAHWVLVFSAGAFVFLALAYASPLLIANDH